MDKTAFLLDVDGVLIEPRGYRAAIHDCFFHFLEMFGLGECVPEEADLAFFESRMLTNEWDIIPIGLAGVLERVLERAPGTVLPAEWTPAAIGGLRLRLPRAEAGYPATAEQAAKIRLPGMAPAEAVALQKTAEGIPFPFPLLKQQPIFDWIFHQNQRVDGSPLTAYFQNLVLGGEDFSQIYGTPALVQTGSYLLRHDVSLLDDSLCQTILRLRRRGLLGLAVVTARPSLAPRGLRAGSSGYSPEAEQALELTGLRDVPLVGVGRLMYAAGQLGRPLGELIKPSPYQALAALFSAFEQDEVAALAKAGQVLFGGLKTPGAAAAISDLAGERLKNQVRVHIFEDSPIGIRAVQAACQKLREAGADVTVHAWGIATDPHKAAALAEAGAIVLEDVNQALGMALQVAHLRLPHRHQPGRY